MADERLWEKELEQCVGQGSSEKFYDKMGRSSSSNTPFQGQLKFLWDLNLVPENYQKGKPKFTWNLNVAPEKDHDIQSDHNSQGELGKAEPEWLESFCKMTFFLSCSKHPICQNELNKYCIDCEASLCQFCVSLGPHKDHRILKIYRDVYTAMVPVDEIQQHIDCSKIQSYKSNQKLFFPLTPLPHLGSKASDDGTCKTCKRELIESDLYCYCSIFCKVQKEGMSLKKCSLEELGEEATEDPNPNKRTSKRKGIPRRAPLF